MSRAGVLREACARPGLGYARARVRVSGSSPPHALRDSLLPPASLWLPEPCPPEVSGDQATVCGAGAGSGTGRAGQVPRGKGLREQSWPQPGLKLWQRLPGLLGWERKRSPLTLVAGCGRSLRAKVRCPAHLYWRRLWAGKVWGMGWPLPILLKSCGRADWEEEAFFPLLSRYHFVAQLWNKSRA